MTNIKVFSGSSHPDLAGKVVERLGTCVEKHSKNVFSCALGLIANVIEPEVN